MNKFSCFQLSLKYKFIIFTSRMNDKIHSTYKGRKILIFPLRVHQTLAKFSSEKILVQVPYGICGRSIIVRRTLSLRKEIFQTQVLYSSQNSRKVATVNSPIFGDDYISSNNKLHKLFLKMLIIIYEIYINIRIMFRDIQ